MKKEEILSVSNLRVSLAGHEVLDDISFKLNRGDVLAIIGPNGAGKTVLLKTILGMYPYRGRINLDRHLRIGYLPQKVSLNQYMRLTVGELFEIKRRLLNIPQSNVDEAVNALHLQGTVLSKQLTALSGGYLQKALLVLALIGEPDIIILDEPTAHIDLAGEREIHKSLHHLMKLRRATILLASHDLHMIHEHADWILGIDKREICFGNPHKILTTGVLRTLFGAHHKRHYIARMHKEAD